MPRVIQSLVFNTQGGLWNLENLILFLVSTWLWQLIPIAFIDSTLFRTLKSQGRAVTSWFSALQQWERQPRWLEGGGATRLVQDKNVSDNTQNIVPSNQCQ